MNRVTSHAEPRPRRFLTVFRDNHARTLCSPKRPTIAGCIVFGLTGLLLSSAGKAELIQVNLSFQNVSASFNGVNGTQIGEHMFKVLVDDAATDMDASPSLGAFQATSVTFTSATLGLFDVLVLNDTYLLTNIGQIALRYDSPNSFYGQFSPFNLPTYMTDNNDLSTIDTSFSASSNAGQWRTNIGDALPLRLESGDTIDGGADNWITSATVSISRVSSSPVPEIDPAGFGSVAALITGALGLIERRRLKATGFQKAA